MKGIQKILLSLSLIALVSACGTEKKGDYLNRMDKEHKGDVPIENAAVDLPQQTKVQGKGVAYATLNGTDVTGYLARPDSMQKKLPGIIVIHEWWGLNNNIRGMTDKLAGEGYAALAVDLYNGKVARSPDSAGTYARSVNKKEAINNLTQAYNYLVEQQKAGSIGTIGWCFGGGWALQTALAHPNKIDASVIYYGRLVTDTDQLKKLSMPILGIFGAEDSGIPPQKVKEFEIALNEAGVSNSIHIYDGAGHAFANPSGKRYVQTAAKDAWKKTTTFLAEHLKSTKGLNK